MQNLRIAVAVGITVIYAAGYVRNLIDPMFNPPSEMTPIALLAIAVLFGSEVIKAVRNGRNGR